MSAVQCPLCCKKTFSSRQSLKIHVDTVRASLACPYCQFRFDSLGDLSEHLDSVCLETLIIDSSGVDDPEILKLSSVENEDGCADVEQEEAEREEENVNEDLDPLEVVEDEISESTGEYFCEMCGVSFDDVSEHLRAFHEGQEVLLEDPREADEPPVDVEILIVDPTVDESPKTPPPSEHTPKIATVKVETCTDKNGHPYTRKIVKIDKFWLPNEKVNWKTLKAPVLQKFVIENSEVHKITEQQENDLGDKSAIIEINECPDCGQLFPALENYLKHKCQKSGKLNCSQCSEEFPDGESLKKHAKLHMKKNMLQAKNKVNSNSGPFNCEECNTSFTSYKSLRLHKRMHEPVRSREVDAPVSYGINADYKITEDTVSQEDNEKNQPREMFECQICNKSYDKQYEQIHLTSHSADNGFNCEVCNRKFFSDSNLQMHMKAHSNNKKFACSYCRKPFVTYDALNEHLANQCQKRAYACQFCGRRFSRPHEKVKHERIHTGEKPHVCDICGKAFRVSYCLTLHLRTHSGTRPYQCKQCFKRFKSHSVFNHHMLTHSDERNYKCPYCPKAFKTSVQLAGHKNSHIKPFSCTECNRPFASLYAVRAHMETHKRDNNLKFECWMCGALYSRTFALRDHLKEQHQQVGGEKAKVVMSVDEEIDAANSILVKEDMILRLEGSEDMDDVVENEMQ